LVLPQPTEPRSASEGKNTERFHAFRSKAQQDGLSKGKPGSFQKAERNVRLEEMRVADK
jgi:hypothetical protein